MKYLGLSLACLISMNASANPYRNQASFSCAGEEIYRNFLGTLDYGSYRPESGYANMINAQIVDGYYGGSLLCHASGVGKFGCVGYAFNTPGNIIEVELAFDPQTKKGSVKYHTIGSADSKEWTCNAEITPINLF